MRLGDARITQATIYCVAMHCPTSSGGKDWYGQVDAGQVLTTCWGPTDNAHSSAQKQGGRAHLNMIVQEKLAKGYSIVDEYDGAHWRSQLTVPAQNSINEGGIDVKPARKVKPPNIMKGLAKPKEALKYDF